MKRLSLSFLLALALPLAAVSMTALPAFAQTAPPAAGARATAPVTVEGRFQRYVVDPRGRVMGMVLQDGTVVHLPRDAAGGPAGALKPYDAVHVEGQAARTPTGTVIVRAVVQQNGKVIADGSKMRGHHGRHGQDGERHARGNREERKDRPQLAPLTAGGRVTGIVSSPHGRAHALLLEDGTTAMGPGIETLGLKVGDRVSVSGKGGAYAQGKALRIETITLPSGETRTLPRHQHHGDKGRGAPPV
jgi:hypothetical protein